MDIFTANIHIIRQYFYSAWPITYVVYSDIEYDGENWVFKEPSKDFT